MRTPDTFTVVVRSNSARDVNHAISAGYARWPLRHRGGRWSACWRCWLDVLVAAYVFAATVVLFGASTGLWRWPCGAG